MFCFSRSNMAPALGLACFDFSRFFALHPRCLGYPGAAMRVVIRVFFRSCVLFFALKHGSWLRSCVLRFFAFFRAASTVFSIIKRRFGRPRSWREKKTKDRGGDSSPFRLPSRGKAARKKQRALRNVLDIRFGFNSRHAKHKHNPRPPFPEAGDGRRVRGRRVVQFQMFTLPLCWKRTIDVVRLRREKYAKLTPDSYGTRRQNSLVPLSFFS